MRGAILVALLLAGCAGQTPDPAATPRPVASIAFADCEQTHTIAPYPMEAFAGMLPEGWSLLPADPAGRTTEFSMSGSRCASGNVTDAGASIALGEAKEVWGYLFVIPPEGTEGSFDAELWPLGGVVSHGDMLRVYEAWGFVDVVVQGETDLTIEASLPGTLSSRTWADNGAEQFEITGAAPHEETAFLAGAHRVWIPADDEDGIAGAFAYRWPEGGTDLGQGEGTLRYNGPLLNAPPAGPVLVHHASGLSVDVTLLE